jgi:hypothetical protein
MIPCRNSPRLLPVGAEKDGIVADLAKLPKFSHWRLLRRLSLAQRLRKERESFAILAVL